MTSKDAPPQSTAGVQAAPSPARPTAERVGDGIFVRRRLLAPFAMMRLLDVLDRLAASWQPSQRLGLLGRGDTHQIRPTDIAIEGRLNEIGRTVAPAVMHWARTCGFRIPDAPHIQMFPVRMVGDAANPAYQEAHVDSDNSQPGPPICTNVFYAKTRGVVGGELIVAPRGGGDLSEPIVVEPETNMLATIAGDRVHGVRPLRGGERLSLVLNFY